MNPEDYQNKLQDERLTHLENSVDEIKDNHLPHIQNDITKISTDVDWLKRFFWVVVSTSIGGLITAVINLLLTINK